MVEPIVYTEEQIEKASYPDLPNDLVTSKIPIKRLDTKNGRTYYQLEVKEEDRVYLYSSTTIIDKVLSKGFGFEKWLGDSQSHKAAMDYAKERADIGSMVHALCMYLIFGKTIDCRDGFLHED